MRNRTLLIAHQCISGSLQNNDHAPVDSIAGKHGDTHEFTFGVRDQSSANPEILQATVDGDVQPSPRREADFQNALRQRADFELEL